MSDSLPIACTLEAAEREQRGADLRSLGRDALLAVDRGERRVVLRFRRDPGIRERVQHVADAESRCCAFLAFDIADEQTATTLTIVAPEGGEAMMHDLASVIAGDPDRAA